MADQEASPPDPAWVHLALDGKHVALCYVCTCTYKYLRFGPIEAVTCPGCSEKLQELQASMSK